jgi:hypothetical protein
MSGLLTQREPAHPRGLAVATPFVGRVCCGASSRSFRSKLVGTVRFFKAVRAGDPDAPWTSINVNHLVPSGGSIFHPRKPGICQLRPLPQLGRKKSTCVLAS